MKSILAIAAKSLFALSGGNRAIYPVDGDRAESVEMRALLEELLRQDEAGKADPMEALLALPEVLPTMDPDLTRIDWPVPGAPWVEPENGDWRERIHARLIWRATDLEDRMTPEVLLDLLKGGFHGPLQDLIDRHPALIEHMRDFSIPYYRSWAQLAHSEGHWPLIQSLHDAGIPLTGLAENLVDVDDVTRFCQVGGRVEEETFKVWSQCCGLTVSQEMIRTYGELVESSPNVMLENACLLGASRSIGAAIRAFAKAMPQSGPVRLEDSGWSVSPGLLVFTRPSRGDVTAWSKCAVKLLGVIPKEQEMTPGVREWDALSFFCRFQAPGLIKGEVAGLRERPAVATILAQLDAIQDLPASRWKNLWLETITYGAFSYNPATRSIDGTPQCVPAAADEARLLTRLAQVSFQDGEGAFSPMQGKRGPEGYTWSTPWKRPFPLESITPDLLWVILYHSHVASTNVMRLDSIGKSEDLGRLTCDFSEPGADLATLRAALVSQLEAPLSMFGRSSGSTLEIGHGWLRHLDEAILSRGITGDAPAARARPRM